jgi:hypothetical protein
MYVDPFWMGVLVTIVVEIVALFGYAVVISNRGKK